MLSGCNNRSLNLLSHFYRQMVYQNNKFDVRVAVVVSPNKWPVMWIELWCFFLLFSCQPCRKNSQAAGDLRHLDAHVTSLKSVLIKAVSRIRHWLLLGKYISYRNTYETHYEYWMRCLDSSGRAEAVISSLIVRKSIKLDGWWTQNTATKDDRFYSKSVKRDTSANKILDELVSYDIKRYGCDDTHLPFAFYSTVIY